MIMLCGCLFDFKNEDIFKDENVREFVNSNVATIPYEVFSEEKTYPFTQMEDVSELTNKEILNRLVNQLIKEGRDVLVRDVSSLGFPSFRIIIPGMTEVTHSKMAGRFAMFEELEYLLKDFHRIDMKNIDKVIQIMETQIDEVGFTSLYTFINIKDVKLLHAENIGQGAKYFLAMCYLMKGKFEKAEKILEEILFVANQFIPNDATTILLKAVYYYTAGMNKIGKHEKVMKYLDVLFDKDIVEVIDNEFKEEEEILVRHYHITSGDYVENDDDYYLPFMQILREAQKKNVISQDEISKIFGKENEKILTNCEN